MSTPSHDQDPHPDLPRCFTKKKDVVELVQEVTSQGALADLIDPTAEEPVPLTVFEPAEDEPDRSWPPEPLVRTCQATTRNSEAFGPMVAAESLRRNFFAAGLRAFLGDGALWIWALHRVFFPTFEAIVDFVHVLTYIYLAAKALGGGADAVWQRYLRWATACWQGRVAEVLEELRRRPGGDDRSGREPRGQAHRSVLCDLQNDRLLRAQPAPNGLPSVSPTGFTGLLGPGVIADQAIQSAVKGTEKFWNEDQAETILQLSAAQLSEDGRLSEHLKKRPISPYRHYKSTKRRKTG